MIVYWFFWRFFRKNRIPIEVIPNLYVSSKFSQKDFEHFQTENTIIVYDLSAELEEINIIKSNHNYHFVPFLDVGTYDLKTTQNLVNQICDRYYQISKNEKILIHCTMGFTRSSVISILVIKNILSLSLKEVLLIMNNRNKNIVIHSYLTNFIEKV